MGSDSELTNSARKRRFFKRLEDLESQASDDSTDEAVAAAESFFKDNETKQAGRSQVSRSFPGHISASRHDKQIIKHEIIVDSGSETQSDVENTKRQQTQTTISKTQIKVEAVGDSSSDTTSGTESPPKLRRVHNLTTGRKCRNARTTGKAPSLKSSVSAPPMVKHDIAKERNGNKRRAKDSQQIECAQIFAGMRFFFVPNDDKNPARGLRMLKLKQHGGERVLDWSMDIDFVAVEDNINHESLLEWLYREHKVDVLPAHMSIVNTKFIGDCLLFKSVLDFMQPCYRVSPSTTVVKPPIEVLPCEKSPAPLPSIELMRQTSNLRSQNRMASPPILSRGQNQEEPSRDTRVAENMVDDKELMQAVKEAKELEFLSFNDSDDGFDNDHKASLASLPYEDTRDWQKNFQCMHSGADATTKRNPNARTISILDQMSRYYDTMGDEFRSLAYRKAATALKKEHRRIVTKKDALAISNIGQSIAEKIEEIALTDRLKKLNNLMDDPRGQVLQLFTGIYGVGMNRASQWVGHGYRTLHDLLDKAKLTDAQKIGIEHYDDFSARIPRDEITQHGEHVRNALRKIDHAYEVTIGGSYRRGKADSGDVDLLITKPGAKIEEIREVVLGQLVPHLLHVGFLTVKLSGGGEKDGNKWHGCSVLPGSTIWRRIDFLLVPWDEMGAALIYFTGNDIFNRSIRLLASKKKMCLNQTGLYGSVLRKRNREKLNDGELLESKSERRIFEILGVPWREPHERDL